MEKLQRLYRDNLNGIIATLAIHLVVMGSLLFAELRNNHDLPDQTLFVDLTTQEFKVPESEKERLDLGSTIPRHERGSIGWTQLQQGS